MDLPAIRVFISFKIPSAIFPNSSVDVVGILLLGSDISGYKDSWGYSPVVVADFRFVLFLRAKLFRPLAFDGTAGVDSVQNASGLDV